MFQQRYRKPNPKRQYALNQYKTPTSSHSTRLIRAYKLLSKQNSTVWENIEYASLLRGVDFCRYTVTFSIYAAKQKCEHQLVSVLKENYNHLEHFNLFLWVTAAFSVLRSLQFKVRDSETIKDWRNVYYQADDLFDFSLGIIYKRYIQFSIVRPVGQFRPSKVEVYVSRKYVLTASSIQTHKIILQNNKNN